MNENEGYVFACPRCGNDMHSTSRYCMKCGYLNPSHPDNQQYSKLINKNGMEGYSVSGGASNASIKVNMNEVRGGAVDTMFGEHTGSFTLCFVLNFLFFLFLIVGSFVGFYIMYSGNIALIFASELSCVWLGISIFGILWYSIQLVYMKMNKRWWTSLIPLVNMYMLSDAINGNKLLNLLVFVPVVGEIYYLILLYKMGKAFKVNGFLTMLFPFIMFPVIGFGSNAFNGVCYVSGRDSLEQEYGKKKSFLVVGIIAIVLSIVMFIYANTVSINKGIDRFSSYYLYFASQRVIRRTKLKVENNVYECDTYGDTIYFYYQDLEDYFSIPFYVYRDPIEAYVKVVITEEGDGILDKYDYYISMTDKRYGFAETPVDELEIEDVVPYTELDPAFKDGNQCYFKRSA